jgi:hypothetical protein
MSDRFNSTESLVADAIGHYGVIHIALPAFPQFASQMQKYIDTIREHTDSQGLVKIAKSNGQDTEAGWFLCLQSKAFDNG